MSVNLFHVVFFVNNLLDIKCIDCHNVGAANNRASSQRCVWMDRIPQHRRPLILLQLTDNGVCLGQTAGIDWLARLV